ncbi:unnamed protein product [Anisakis simplex]|uniref:DUF3849 domain-containing protein n=1 Tax=Anisakis simplex TaxID=6269 RepID=A0A0M3K6D6_ANISI|nr:unnamed protein product [Anisakis simplex]
MKVAQMSDEDRRRVEELRELVKQNLTEYYDTDFNLLRWLQGHPDLELKDIAEKLNQHLKLRSTVWKFDEMWQKPMQRNCQKRNPKHIQQIPYENAVVVVDQVRMLSSSKWRQEILKYASAKALPRQWNINGEDVFKADVIIPTPYDKTLWYINRNEKVKRHLKTNHKK